MVSQRAVALTADFSITFPNRINFSSRDTCYRECDVTEPRVCWTTRPEFMIASMLLWCSTEFMPHNHNKFLISKIFTRSIPYLRSSGSNLHIPSILINALEGATSEVTKELSGNVWYHHRIVRGWGSSGQEDAKYVFLRFVEEKSSRSVNRCIFIVCCLMCVYGLSCYEIFSSRSTPFFSRIASSKFTISDAWPRRSVANAAPAMLLKWYLGHAAWKSTQNRKFNLFPRKKSSRLVFGMKKWH